MQHHGGAQGFTELLLSMGFPGVDSGWIEREEVIPAEFRLYTETRSGESNSSGSGSGGGGSGELYDGLDGGSRASTEDGAPSCTDSPRSPEPWGNMGCDFVPEELEGDFPPGLYTEINVSTQTVISSSDGEDLNTHEDYCSERPQDTQTSKKRPLVIDIDEELPGGPSDNAAEKPSVAHTWEKRPRVGKIPDFRTSTNGRKSALESKLRKFGDRKSDAVVTPVSGLEFDSLAEAFDFYNLYSWEVGFGIRYGTSRKNIVKSLTMQEILCGCAGSPRHDKTRSMACGCQAMIRLQQERSLDTR
ncbi:uncharacterized protein LOC124666551 isoform X1 [Lolium rigidum]|uniref:uncharacterized protein LOC124666551 isoform X1 n=1 Tax=Lolium rigidum TaxID=89674 RepID=UPI001F5DF6D3|nr:uncharacterized protein LOC124666551 isoform X1 [Lolium rigidum]